MGDIFGFVILFALIIYITTSPSFRVESRIVWLSIIIVLIKFVIAYLNGFVGPTIGGAEDAVEFHERAIVYSESLDFSFGFGHLFYTKFVGIFYALFGPSMFLACMLSVAALTFASKFLLDICDLLEMSDYKFYVLMGFGLLPSLIMNGSLALREAYQLVFFILALKYYIVFYLEQKFRYFILGMVFSVMLGLLHEGMLLVGLGLIPVATLFNVNRSRQFFILLKSKSYAYFLMILGVLVVIALLPLFAKQIDIITSLMDGNLERYATTYRSSLTLDSIGSGYDAKLDFSSLFMLVVSTLKIIFYYLFYPFPWNVTRVLDVYGFSEVLWRGILIYYSFKGWYLTKGKLKGIKFFMLAAYFMMAFIWATGTTNYGQSLRHNDVHYWIILTLGMPYLVMSLRSFSLNRLGIKRFSKGGIIKTV